MDLLKVRSDITDLIKLASMKQGIEIPKIVDVKPNEKGEGFLGEIFIVTVIDDNNNNNKKNSLDLVLKCAFKDEKIRQAVPIRKSFENEIAFYLDIFPKLDKFRNSSDNGFKVPNDYVPKCYEVSLNNDSEIIVLENLFKSGFEVFDKREILDANHIELIFKTYGHFHGLSLAYKEQYKKEFDRLKKITQNVYFEFLRSDGFRASLVSTGDLVNSTLKSGENDHLREKYAPYLGEGMANLLGGSISEDCDYSVILHGDCWSNNMMFKYQGVDNDRKAVDIKLIDFQLVKVGNPVCDLSYCLYSGGDKKEFDKLDEFLKVYHDALSATVRNLGGNPDKVLSFEQLKEEWKKWSKFGFIMASVVMKIKMTDKQDIIDLTDLTFDDGDEQRFLNQKFDEKAFQIRMRNLISHMITIDAI